MIKVSHEMPLCLLKDGTERRYNDYFYALVHLFEDHPDYYEYVVQALKEGREIILDNSAYELNGRPFDTENFVGWINRLNEDSDGAAARRLTYIIPDVFDEMEETYELTERFLKNYNPPGRAMAVCQGKTIEELSTIFINYTHTQGLWKIGINFMSKAYLDFFVKAFGYTHGSLDPQLENTSLSICITPAQRMAGRLFTSWGVLCLANSVIIPWSTLRFPVLLTRSIRAPQ